VSCRLFDLSHDVPHEPTFAAGQTFGRGAVLPYSVLTETKLAQTSLLVFSDHVSTHVEAPAHFHPGGKTIDQMPPELFAEVPAVWLDCSGGMPGEPIGPAELDRAAGGPPRAGEAVLLYTGCSREWGKPAYRSSLRPLEPASVEWLIAQGVKLFGVDGPEIDDDPIRWPAHQLLRRHEFYIIENLALWPAVAELPRRFRLIAMPLAIQGATAAPARVVAVAG
jgi:kynurenine formamidase